MTPPDLNYDIHNKELLAIVAANLAYFTTTKELTQHQVRWAEELAPYDIKITY
ncbi:hypothetical protein VTN00DRAFT_3036 [Thermoascus crustaceus]|uniref:uncharacterized protein n=1 Tax=Thermoascus crustaceus TaxID=5088 RepID=UPI0037436223